MPSLSALFATRKAPGVLFRNTNFPGRVLKPESGRWRLSQERAGSSGCGSRWLLCSAQDERGTHHAVAGLLFSLRLWLPRADGRISQAYLGAVGCPVIPVSRHDTSPRCLARPPRPPRFPGTAHEGSGVPMSSPPLAVLCVGGRVNSNHSRGVRWYLLGGLIKSFMFWRERPGSDKWTNTFS